MTGNGFNGDILPAKVRSMFPTTSLSDIAVPTEAGRRARRRRVSR